MKSHTETSRLYVTSDKHNEGVYFARTNKTFFARFYQSKYGWEIWIYPWKVSILEHTITDTLNRIDIFFKKFWREKCDTQ